MQQPLIASLSTSTCKRSGRGRERENYIFFLRIKSDIILTAPFLAMIADYWKKLMVGTSLEKYLN